MVALASYQVAGLIGAAFFVCLYWFGVGVFLIVEERRQQRRQEWRRQAGQEYVRDLAEFSIRRTRRRAIQEMLAAEREYHDVGGSGDVIEGTAVEVRR